MASIYKYIEKELGLHISYSQRVIEVQPCTDDDRKYLDLNGTDYVVVVKTLLIYMMGVSSNIRNHVTA